MPVTALELPAWVEWNEWRTGVRAHRFSVSLTPDGPDIRAILYLDRRGRVKLPPNNPFLPVTFRSARLRPSGRTADWLKVAAPLAEEMRQRQVLHATSLPPDVDDVRPWQWRQFLVGVRYTYCLDFPFDIALADRETRRHCEKAAKAGMTVERVTSIEPLIECLTETEARKGFSHGISPDELRVALSLMGSDNLRLYACFDAEGRPAAARAIIHLEGSRAIAWMAGTRTTRLGAGANYLLWRFSLDDLSTAGAVGIDLSGANIEPVAMFTSQWGGSLVPTYFVRTHSVRAAARFLADWRLSPRGRLTGRA